MKCWLGDGLVVCSCMLANCNACRSRWILRAACAAHVQAPGVQAACCTAAGSMLHKSMHTGQQAAAVQSQQYHAAQVSGEGCMLATSEWLITQQERNGAQHSAAMATPPYPHTPHSVPAGSSVPDAGTQAHSAAGTQDLPLAPGMWSWAPPTCLRHASMMQKVLTCRSFNLGLRPPGRCDIAEVLCRS